LVTLRLPGTRRPTTDRRRPAAVSSKRGELDGHLKRTLWWSGRLCIPFAFI